MQTRQAPDPSASAPAVSGDISGDIDVEGAMPSVDVDVPSASASLDVPGERGCMHAVGRTADPAVLSRGGGGLIDRDGFSESAAFWIPLIQFRQSAFKVPRSDLRCTVYTCGSAPVTIYLFLLFF